MILFFQKIYANNITTMKLYIPTMCDWLHQSYVIIQLSLNHKLWYHHLKPKWPALVLACCSSFHLNCFDYTFETVSKGFCILYFHFPVGWYVVFFSSIMLNKLHIRLWHLYLSSCFKGFSMNILSWMRLSLHELHA